MLSNFLLLGWLWDFATGTVGTVLSIIWFVIVLVALYNIWTSRRQELPSKLLWTLFILLFPILGILCWWLFGKR
jgi:uncharacterized membrane protein